MPNCPTDEPKTVTQPHFVQAVTLNTIEGNGRVNVHLDDGLDMVYKAQTLDSAIHGNIALIAGLAYVHNVRATITWEGGADVADAVYCQRHMTRITLEGDHGLIPWAHREDPCA